MVHTYTINSFPVGFSTSFADRALNTDPKYIKTDDVSIKLTFQVAPGELLVNKYTQPNWLNECFAVWVYIENVDLLDSTTAFKWAISSGSDVRYTLPRSAFVNGWNEIRINLRDDLGFNDDELRVWDIPNFSLVWNVTSVPFTIYVDEIRLIKLDDTPVDKSVLDAKISEAQVLYNTTPTGSQPGQVPEEAKNAFREAIESAADVSWNQYSTQAQVDRAVTDLEKAIQDFMNAIIP